MVTLAVVYGFIKKYWVVFAIIGVLIVGALTYNCLKPQPSLNQKETEQIINGIREGNNQKIIDGLAESDARVKVGVDEVAKTDEEARKVEEAKQEAKQDYSGWTSEQLAAEAERRLQK